jgi:hypothetical protein
MFIYMYIGFLQYDKFPKFIHPNLMKPDPYTKLCSDYPDYPGILCISDWNISNSELQGIKLGYMIVPMRKGPLWQFLPIFTF